MIVLLSAVWLGILTSISPCPLATNIAAISFLTKKINHPSAVFFAGLAYSLGRMIAYAVLGAIIIGSLVSVPTVAIFLQKYMNMVLGPALLIVGLFLLDILKFRFSKFALAQEKQDSLASSGILGAFILGAIFALSFCPISAALFFGSLIPLALKSRIGFVLPFLYGIGTALPVIVFAVGIALGVFSAAHVFQQFKRLEKYMKKVTGYIFVIVGGYYVWIYLISRFLLKSRVGI